MDNAKLARIALLIIVALCAIYYLHEMRCSRKKMKAYTNALEAEADMHATQKKMIEELSVAMQRKVAEPTPRMQFRYPWEKRLARPSY